MKLKAKAILILVFIFLSPAVLLGSNDPASIFDSGEHCVAYRTKKRIFLLYNVEVIGKNCDISSEIIPVVGDKYFFELTAPIQSFQSGEIERDRDVAKILKQDIRRDVVFRSVSMTKQEWGELYKKGEFILSGTITIGENKFPLDAKVEMIKSENGVEVLGLVQTNFKNFKIDPPKMAAGLAARVSNKVEFIFRIQSAQTLGAGSLLKL